MSKHAKHFPAQGDMFHIPEYSASQNRYQIATGRRFPTSEIRQYCTPYSIDIVSLSGSSGHVLDASSAQGNNKRAALR